MSLIASMFTNVREQKYEIAILRSIGLTRFQIARVYIHEAFVLLLASTALGSIIGMIMGKTLTMDVLHFSRINSLTPNLRVTIR